MPTPNDETELDALAAAFFDLFTLEEGGNVNLDSIHDMFASEGVIVKAGPGEMVTYDVDSFVEPRLLLLNGGELTCFREEEVDGRTEISGKIAQRFSTYRKRGVLSGEPFEGLGTKFFQFVKFPAGWKIVALVWEDEP
ncbi:MAG: DUF4440 domain-containing protein [Candidatus Eremiobacteraeota bacterium]|nr:DUF4440 domain-containing protein [Candidatus Eremiobacteraeota bacterium]